MKQILGLAVCAVLGLAALPASAQIVSLPGLFTTGVDNAGVSLGGAAVDTHYTVLDGAFPGANALTMSSIPGSYIPNNATSRWIWENASGQPTNVTRTFRTTFDLTGFDPTTAILGGTWATDNLGLNIRINGTATGLTSPGFGAYTNFGITSGFVPGINTLDFVVRDVGVISGFRVGSIEGRARVLNGNVPEPGTLALLAAMGLTGMGALLRRRRK